MRSLLHITLAMLLAGCGDAAQHAAEKALHQGAAPYHDQRYAEAAAIYASATYDPRVAYNLGNALYRMNLPDSATKTFGMVPPSDADTALLVATRYNMANAWTTIALEADSAIAKCQEQLEHSLIEGEDIARKVRMAVTRDSLIHARQRLDHLVDSALIQGANAYKGSLRMAPADEDARYNLAFVQRWIAQEKNEEKTLTEKALLLMKKADELVDLYKFTEALQLLQEGLKAEPSLQQKQEYMNKLDVVTKAAKAQ